MSRMFIAARRLVRGAVLGGVVLGSTACDDAGPAGPTESLAVTSGTVGQVTDLRVIGSTDSSLTIRFTGVDNGTGNRASYDVRVAPAPITWGSASQVSSGTCATPVTGVRIGRRFTCSILGLAPGTGYEVQVIAFRGTLDRNAEFGALSNVAAGQTTDSRPAVATIVVSPGNVSGTVGDQGQFTAAVRDTSGATLEISVVWSSTDTTVVRIDSTGRATAVGAGSAQVTATAGDVAGHADVTVTGSAGPAVASVVVTPGSASGNVGDAAQFTATVRDADGNTMSSPAVAWESTDTTVVTITSTGWATAVGPGSADLVARAGAVAGVAHVTVAGSVSPAPVAQVQVAPATVSLGVGATATLQATLRDAAGNVLTGRTVTWSSANLAVATVTSGGTVTGLLPGSATISATAEGVSGAATVTVTLVSQPPPPSGWPNQPSGFQVVTDQPWDLLNSLGWGQVYNTGLMTTSADLTAPQSAPSVLQFMYPSGFNGGQAPATAYRGLTTSDRVYVGMWWRANPEWEGHPTNVNKLQYLFTNSQGSVFMALYGGVSGPYELRVFPQFNTSQDVWLRPNVNSLAITPGDWYRIEWLVEYTGAGRGRIRWWVNGTLLGDHGDLPFPSERLAEYKLAPVWGGSGGVKSRTDYFWFDHVRVATQ